MKRTNDLLVEIGTEELPPADVRPAMAQLEASVRMALTDLRIDAGQVMTYGTPRRLVIFCTDVATRQRPLVQTVKGPPAHVAYDPDGHPTQAAVGFARSQGVPVEALQVEEVGGKRYVIASRQEAGDSTARVIPQAFVEAVGSLTFSKTMRWGAGDVRFVRPVRWVLALFGTQLVHLEIAGVRAGRKTFGHRVLSPGARAVKSPRAYFRVLLAGHVILDPDERQRRITTESQALAGAVHSQVQLDPRLVEETVMTTEHPVALRGTFSREFLSLPSEVLVTVMQHHQKYFPVVDHQQHLQAYFIAVRDGGRQHLAQVRESHEWVLHARLADADFFLTEDRVHRYYKRSLPEKDQPRRLEEYVPELAGLVIQAQLGTMADKVLRLGALAAHVSEVLRLSPAVRAKLDRAVLLGKADLVTHLVREFPELQGVVGGIYASLDGEDADVGQAIREHYRPTGAADQPPKGLVGALLGVIDRVDTVVGLLAAGLVPSGSQDPYGLRRAAQGLIDIFLSHHLSIPLTPLIAAAAKAYGKTPDGLVEQVRDFVWQRMRTCLIDRGLRYDLVDAALAVSGDDVLEGANRASALQAFAARPEFVRLYVAFDRASRILGAGAVGVPDPKLFKADAERSLHGAATLVRELVDAAVEEGDYAQALEALVSLADPVDKLFDDVLIMVPDPRVQANRLALLGRAVTTFRAVADFSKVVMTDEAVREQAKAPEPHEARQPSARAKPFR